MTGKSMLQENPGVIESGLFEHFVRVTETGIPHEHEHYYPHEQFDAWFHQTEVKMGDGFVMNAIDITARKKAEQELKETKDLLQTIFDTSPNSITAYAPVYKDGELDDFQVVFANAFTEKT